MAALKNLLHILNSIYTVIGLALTATSLWFFVFIYELTSMRNRNHYLLDYSWYWPQVVPWMFFFSGVFILIVSVCGFVSVRKDKRGLLKSYIVCMGIVILVFVVIAGMALALADNKATDDFIKDTVWDVYFQSKSDTEVATAFGNIEKKLQCCGAENPRDYKNWKTEFPVSCCDVYYHGWLDPYSIDCDFTNKLANERYGCSVVVSQYARIAIKVMSAAAILMAFLAIITLLVAVLYSRSISKPKVRLPREDVESKKILY